MSIRSTLNKPVLSTAVPSTARLSTNVIGILATQTPGQRHVLTVFLLLDTSVKLVFAKKHGVKRAKATNPFQTTITEAPAQSLLNLDKTVAHRQVAKMQAAPGPGP